MANMTIGLNASTATTAQFALGNLAADGTVELQLACPNRNVSKPEDLFQFCVCPIVNIPKATPYTANGLNQDATYYVRARPLRASGAREPWSNILGFKTPVSVARDWTVPAVVVEEAVIIRPEPILDWLPRNADAGYPGKNVSRDSPVAWRSTQPDGGHFMVLQHAGAPIDTLAILQTNLPEATTVQVRGDNSYAGVTGGAPAYASAVSAFRASPNMPGRPGFHGLIQLPAAIAYPFILIFLTTPAGGTPGNLIHVEHIVIGLNRKTKNFSLESTETGAHLGTKERSRSGIADKVEGLKMRRADFELAFLTETQSETNYFDANRWLDDTIFCLPNGKNPSPARHDRLLFGDVRGVRVSRPTSIHATRAWTVDSII